MLAKFLLTLCLVEFILIAEAKPINNMDSSAFAASSDIIKITKKSLKDKIRGGWAGQTIGVTFGGPTEFKFSGTIINDYQPIPWYDGYIKKTMIEYPALYDDIYMDLTFVDDFEKKGLQADAKDFAEAYTNAGYLLWHANQAGRYNILHGIDPPESGSWIHNPHADCIDYQIEADFAGLMSPGMPNTASAISDKVGHIMNYGDGWYGGVYIGAMYTLAYTTNDIHKIVSQALKTIPEQSKFYQCINDVVKWHKKYPDDWKQTWFEIQRKWTNDIGCPDGVFQPLNIDAKVNAAYVVLGLLYGNGDFTRTMEITTRCGQDSDCNPSSAGGILGTILGYNKIPAYWKAGLTEAESIVFKYTKFSLNDVYEISYKHAINNILRNGGKETIDAVTIPEEDPRAVMFEKSFDGLYPIERKGIWKNLDTEFTFDFEGTGFVLRGEAAKWGVTTPVGIPDFKIEIYLDNKLIELVDFPANYITRRHEVAWVYKLKKQKHFVKVKLLNPNNKLSIFLQDLIVYSDTSIQATGINF